MQEQVSGGQSRGNGLAEGAVKELKAKIKNSATRSRSRYALADTRAGVVGAARRGHDELFPDGA